MHEFLKATICEPLTPSSLCNKKTKGEIQQTLQTARLDNYLWVEQSVEGGVRLRDR